MHTVLPASSKTYLIEFVVDSLLMTAASCDAIDCEKIICDLDSPILSAGRADTFKKTRLTDAVDFDSTISEIATAGGWEL